MLTVHIMTWPLTIYTHILIVDNDKMTEVKTLLDSVVAHLKGLCLLCILCYYSLIDEVLNVCYDEYENIAN